MRAEVKAFHSPDLNLDRPQVHDAENFGVLIQVLAGPATGAGMESYDVVVCTPAWLADRVLDGPLIGRHYLIVADFNWASISSFLRKVFDSTIGDDWDEIAHKLARIGHWEFEDYSE